MANRTAAKRKAAKKVARKRKIAKRPGVKRAVTKRKAVKRRPVRASAPRVQLDAALAAEEEQLKAELDAAIGAFNRNRAAILKKAFDEGGDEQVAKLEQQHDALRAAFFDLLKAQLDRNNPKYVELTTAATRETTALKSVIESLANVASILNRATSVVKLVGKVTSVLAL